MDQTIGKWIKRGLGLLIPLVFLMAGCSPSQQEMAAKDKLERVRSLYLKARANPDVQAYAPAALDDAGKTLQAAEQTKDYKMMEHLSYLAEKKSQIAMTLAERNMAEKEREALSREAIELQLQIREHQIGLAREEAEARTREAEQARQAAAAEAARAERSRREAEEARIIALAEAEKADKARLMALLEVERAEKAKREVEREKETIRRNLEGLTGWQRHFVARFLLESRTQIPESDVGGYRMVWGDEVQVLINKGIIREHRNAGVYEIEPKYHDYLKDHLDRDTGALV